MKYLKYFSLLLFLLLSIVSITVYSNYSQCKNFTNLQNITSDNISSHDPCISDLTIDAFTSSIRNTFAIPVKVETLGLNINSIEGECSFEDLLCKFAQSKNLKADKNSRTNIFIVGIDSRKDRNNKLTDTMMMISYDHKTGKSIYISFPRDLYIYYQRTNGVNTSYKLNAVYAIDGVEGLNYTIEQITNLNIHYYVYVNLDSFTKVIDSLGTIEIYLDEPFKDLYPCVDVPANIQCKTTYSRAYGEFSFPKGLNEFDSFDALVYTRARKNSSDFDRANRQQNLIKSLVKQVSGDMENVLSNLDTYIGLYNNVRNDIYTNVGPNDVLSVFSLISKQQYSEPIQITLEPSLNNYSLIENLGILPEVGYSIGFKDTSHKSIQGFINRILNNIAIYGKNLNIAVLTNDPELTIKASIYDKYELFEIDEIKDYTINRIYNISNQDQTVINHYKNKFDAIEFNTEIDSNLINEYKDYDLIITLNNSI